MSVKKTAAKHTPPPSTPSPPPPFTKPITPPFTRRFAPCPLVQIFLVIGFLEFWSELSTPQNKHYMAGGRPGDFPDFTYGEDGIPHPVPFNFYDPFKWNKNMSPEKSEKGLLKEINNGRLAMIGILGFLAEQSTPGSVPLLSGVVPSYSGEVMAPFTTNIIGQPFGL